MALELKKDRGWSKKTVETIAKEMKRIRKASGGILTATAVLEEARDEASPLHRHFDWDDNSAAEKYRLGQARELIRHVQVVVNFEGTDRDVRQYLRVVKDDVAQYVTTAEIRADENLSAQVVQAARLSLEAWLKRYEMYSAMFQAVQHTKEAIESLPEEAEAGQ